MSFLLLSILGVAAATPHRVLLVHSFGRDYAPFDAFTRNFRNALAKEMGEPLVFYDVNLESALVGGESSELPFTTYLGRLFEDQPPDLVVPIGGPATRFAQRQRSHLFPNKPMLIAGTDDRHVQNSLLATNDSPLLVAMFVIGNIGPPTTPMPSMVSWLPNRGALATVCSVANTCWPAATLGDFLWFALRRCAGRAFQLGLLSRKIGESPADALKSIEGLTGRAAQALGEVRTISQALRPVALEQIGLTGALEWMARQTAESSSAKFSVEIEDIDGLLSPGLDINLYRIVQEALNNVLKHARASHVSLEGKRLPDKLCLSIFDDGIGFDAGTQRDGINNRRNGASLGLVSMTERAKLLGGNPDIKSAPGTGTRLDLTIPVYFGNGSKHGGTVSRPRKKHLQLS